MKLKVAWTEASSVESNLGLAGSYDIRWHEWLKLLFFQGHQLLIAVNIRGLRPRGLRLKNIAWVKVGITAGHRAG
eukprot:1158892-Pelagomonas_calceolata.AAC.10